MAESEANGESAEGLLAPVRERYVARLGVALLVAVALLVVVGFAVQAATADQVRSDARAELTTSATVQANAVDQWLQGNKRQARTVSELPAMTAEDPADAQPKLNGLVDRGHVAGEVVAIHLVDRGAGEIVASSEDQFVGASPAEEGAAFAPKLQEGFEGPDEVFVTDPFRIDLVDFPIVAALSPVPDSQRVVVLMINPTGQTSELDQPVAGGHTHVVTADGEPVASPGQTGDHAGSVAGSAIERAVAGETGVVELAGGDLMGFAAVGSQEWVVLTHVPRSAAFALTETVRTGIGGMLLVAILALGLVGLTVGRNTANALESLAGAATDVGEGSLDVTFDVDRPDELGTLSASLARMRDSLQAQISDAREARETAERRQREAEALNDHLATKAQRYEADLDAIAAGDLTRRVDADSRSDAMAAVGDSINKTVAALEHTVAEVQSFAAAVETASHEVDTGAEESRRASEQASEAVGTIADGAAEQDELLDDVAAEMETLSATAQQAASATDDLASLSEQAADAGEQGREAARAAIEEMNEVEAQTEQAVERIETLDEEMAVIGEVTELITDIAEQTNILALNASIEAARAGEAGEGFAVVADEVKSLAEETRDAAEDIEQRVEHLQAETDATVADIQATRERLGAGIATVEDAIAALEDIAAHVEDTDAGVQEIANATAQQANTAQTVAAMVDDLTAISDRTSAEAGRVASAAEEQTATLNEVSENAATNADRADELADLLGAFTVGDHVETDGEQGVAGRGED